MLETTQLQEYYIDELTALYAKRQRLSMFSERIRYVFARETIIGAWPTVTELPTVYTKSMGTGNILATRPILVNPTELANVLSCAIGTDPNYALHTGEKATAQTGILVAGVCGVAVSYAFGGILRSIIPFRFKEGLTINKPAIITLKILRETPEFLKVHMEGYTEDMKKKSFSQQALP